MPVGSQTRHHRLKLNGGSGKMNTEYILGQWVTILGIALWATLLCMFCAVKGWMLMAEKAKRMAALARSRPRVEVIYRNISIGDIGAAAAAQQSAAQGLGLAAAGQQGQALGFRGPLGGLFGGATGY